LPVNTPLERYVAVGPGPSPLVCSIVICAFGLAHDGCRSTCESSSKTSSGGASIWIVNSGMGPPSDGRLGDGVHRVDEPPDAVPTASLEERHGDGEFPGRSGPLLRTSSTPVWRTDAAELPVSSEGGRDGFFGRARLRADVLADRDVALHDRVAKRPEPFDLDLYDVSGFDRARMRRRAGQDDVAGRQRDRPRDVCDQVVHVPDHLVGVPRLRGRAIDPRLDRLVVEVPVVHEARSEWAQGVRALHTEHRARIGVAEVVEAEVVRDREAADERPDVVRADVLRLPTDHDGDLAFVVEETAPWRPHHFATVRVQRRDRLVEIRRSLAELHLELRPTTLVVQVDADDLRRLDG